MTEPIGWRAVRWLYAAFYIASGVCIAATVLGIAPPPDIASSPESAAFQQALTRTGFIMPLLSIICIAAGIALLFHRSAPLGIVLLAPAIVVIFLTNLLLTDSLIGAGLVWGGLHAGILAALAWHFRTAFAPLWNHPPFDATQAIRQSESAALGQD